MNNKDKLDLNSVEAIELAEIKSLLIEMRELEVNRREREEKQRKVRFVIQMVTCSLLAIMTIGIIALLPKIYGLAADSNKMMVQVDNVLTEADDAVSNLNKVSSDLAKVDIPGLFDEVDSLVNDSQESVAKAAETLDSINIDDLNDSITALKAIVQPMSRLFGNK